MDRREKAEELFKEGKTHKEIGEQLNVHRSTVTHWLREKNYNKFDSKRFTKEGTEVICSKCGRKYIKDRKRGHKGILCNSCSSRKKENSYKEKISQIIGTICCKCGYDKCEEAIEYHHIKEKDFNISSSFTNKSFKNIMKEIKKCIPLCANCHREYHYKKWNYLDLNLDNLKSYQKELILSCGGISVDTNQEQS